MKIAIEIGWGHKAGGARRAAINILLELIKLRPNHKFVVYSNCRHPQFKDTIIQQEVLSPPKYISQMIWDQFIFPHIALPRAIGKLKPDVVCFTNNIASFWGCTPCVVNILDMTPFVIPESFHYFHGLYQRIYFRQAVKKAKRIITISENSKKDICQILKVPKDQIVVIPLAANLQEIALSAIERKNHLKQNFGITQRFLLYVGAIHPRKNVKRIIEAFAKLKFSKKIPHQLVIAGAMRWQGSESTKSELFEGVKEHVVFTGRVTDDDLVNLYRSCDVFLCPSLYEGFGIPVLEAMSLGAPVVTSNISSLPELAGDAAILVNPYDVEDIANGISKILDNPAIAKECRERGLRRATEFSWANTAEKVLKIIEEIESGP